MSWDRLVRITPPAAKPLGLVEGKAHLRVDASDDDAKITRSINAAIALIDGPRGIGICMIEQTWRLTLDSFLDRRWQDFCLPLVFGRRRFPQAIPLILGPVSAITRIEYDAADGTVVQLAEGTDFKFLAGVDPQLVFPPFGKFWPIAISQPGAVRIEFKAGFGPLASDVPDDLIEAMLFLLEHFYENRSAVVGATARVSPDIMPLSAQAILDRYRVGLFG